MKKIRNLDGQINYSLKDNLEFKWSLKKVLLTVLTFTLSFTQVIALDIHSGNNYEGEIEEGTFLKQQIQISGVVSDADGPLPGATVMVKGTTKGTTTDFDGNYSLEVDSEEAVLIFSFVGYKTQEIVVGNQTTLNVTLISDSQLDEVVVIGYTTRKKGDVTGSVSTVKSESLGKTGTQDLAKSLSGKVSGLIISDRGGLPGSTGDLTLLIRGKSTLGNNSPLILIDGIQAGNFSQLAPQDIESLTVLKDGAAAIYGARAANGVILITTKRGKTGKPKISFSSSYNLSSFSASPSLMNSEQFAIYNNEIAERKNESLPYSQADIDKYAAGNDPNYPNTNWADLTFADYSPETRTSLSVSGGSEYVKYFVSGDMIRQTGMYDSGDLKFKQNQVRSNIDVKISDAIKLGVDLSGRFGKNLQPGVDDAYIYKHIYTNLPTEVGVYDNGLPGWGGENGANPYVMSSDETGFIKRIDNDLRGKVSLDIELDKLTEGLVLKTFGGYRRMNNDQKSWYTPWSVYSYQESTDEYIEQPGFSQRGNERILRESFWKYDELMLNATLHYNRTFGDHTVGGFVGYEQMTSESRTFWVEKRGFPDADHSELFAGNSDGQQSDGNGQEWGRVNYFGSLSYDFKKKYYVDFTLRHDGSSTFGPNNRFGTFPGVQVAWSIDKESFMDNVEWLSTLKLRSSWAKMGNDRINGFQYLTRYNYAGALGAQPNYYVFGGQPYNGFSSIGVPAANPNVTWESADMKNLGLNFALFDNRLVGDFNYFYQKREDILITRNASIPDFTGLTLPQENLGKVDNYGWELELGWNDEINENLSYNLGFNYTKAKNEVKYLDEAVDVPEALKREGHPMDSYITYPTNGLFKNQEEIDAAPAILAGTVPGEPYYIDTNDDGKITAADRVRSYSSNVPEVQYGIYGGVKFKNWDFSFLFQGQAKAKMLVFFEGQGALPDFMFDQRWTPENTDARYPRAFDVGDSYSSSLNGPDNFQGADLWLRDASYLRLKEVELAYTIPKNVIKFSDVKLYFRGYNLLTMFSEVYDLGLDPEAAGYNGFRLSTYPSLKTYSFGINLNF
ncbi:TonB-dependent receptor [Aureibaculum marinum]|uniref:TonB-dependent receptor n=1 Tax=Aureibaculum marinum TaxID=2487930 RepID=A0A3N4NMN7_9FLAO|nr:TonB-dependent receptor [Aureibaculum marinum]RPD93360.1 TonB-dependent receptor [Aureibaculum marinum]